MIMYWNIMENVIQENKMNKIKTLIAVGLVSLMGACAAKQMPIKMTKENNVCSWRTTRPVTREIITGNEGKIDAYVEYFFVDYECDNHMDRMQSEAKAWYMADDRSIVEKTYDFEIWRDSVSNISNPELKEYINNIFNMADAEAKKVE